MTQGIKNRDLRGKDCNEREKALFWFLAALCCLVLFPFLGLTDFNTKGEPREAVVSLSMLESSNWILPVNNGGELPYKPPFFHWLVALFSLLTSGEVTEYTSRLPSALFLTGLVLGTFAFFRRRIGTHTAFLTALLTFTSLELHRAGMNTRVDMVLTALTVGAIMSLYIWYERGMHRLPWLAMIMMSAATLTKGPVGILVPCLVTGVFMLLRGINFFKALIWMIVAGILSMILPLCWYLAAYGQGGNEFLNLVMEENFGRMTSTMSYDSCVNPWPYNVLSLITGWLPWTLAALLALFSLRRSDFRLRKVDAGAEHSGNVWKNAWRRICGYVREMKPVRLMSLTAIAVIFLFYCFPQSKRSVYLMPLYPFMGMFLAELMERMWGRSRVMVKVLGDVMSGVTLLFVVAFVAVVCGAVPDSVVDHGRHVAQNLAMLHAVEEINGLFSWFWMMWMPLAAILWFAVWRRNDVMWKTVTAVAMIVCACYISLAGTLLPAMLNVRSAKPVAERIEDILPEKAPIFEFIGYAEFQAGDPVHFFELNFYLGDRIRNFIKEHPNHGYLVVSDDDARDYFPQFEDQGYRFRKIESAGRPLMKHTSSIYIFERTGEERPVGLTNMHP